MLIDIVFVILVVVAIFKGFSRGFIVAVFSLLAFIIGLAAAIKLSAVVASWLGTKVTLSEKWLPVIAFAIVLIVVVLLVRIGAKLIEKTVQLAMLGWLNRLGCIILYVILYIMIYSVVLFYAHNIGLIKQNSIDASATFSYVQPIGPKVIEGFGKIIPVFKNMFHELGQFFGGVSERVKY